MQKFTNFENLINTVVKEAAGKKKITPLEFAKDIGVDLTLEKAIEIMKKHLKDAHIVEADAGSKARQLSALALMLATGFISAIQAQNEPLVVRTNFGVKTYEAKDLKRMSKNEPENFAIIMELAAKQQAAYTKSVFNRAKGYGNDPIMKGYEKEVKTTEDLSDDFGNEGRLIKYNDGTQDLKGDILHGGVSFRKKLEQRGEIIKNEGPYATQDGKATFDPKKD